MFIGVFAKVSRKIETNHMMRLIYYLFFMFNFTLCVGAKDIPSIESGTIVLVVAPSARLNVFAFIPLANEYHAQSGHSNGLMDFEQYGLATFPQIELNLDQYSVSIINTEFAGMLKQSSSLKSGSDRFRYILNALGSLSPPVRIYPCIAFGSPKALRFDNSKSLISQIPIGNLSLRVEPQIKMEDWKTFSLLCRKSLNRSLGIKDTPDFDSNRFWSVDFPLIVSSEQIEVQTLWCEAKYGVVCFSWRKKLQSGTTSDELAEALTSLIAPASGVIGIND